MEYRHHGGLKVSEVGVGCYGLSGVYGKVDVAEFQRMVHRAHALGVNFFDTADVYGDAERILGEVVSPFRDEVLLATKVGPRAGVKANLSREYVLEACGRSLARLDTDYIDLYQVHFDDPDTPVAETVAALEELVDQGAIRRYGVGHLPWDRVAAYCEAGTVFSAMMELSAVARGALEERIPQCRKLGLGVLAFSTTGRGLLTGRFGSEVEFEEGDIRRIDPLFQRESLESGRRVADRVSALASRMGRTSVQAAIAWILSHAEVLCALTGPSTVAHLEENVGGSGWAIPPAELEAFAAFLREEDGWLAEKQWATVRRILSEPLASEPARAFQDLVYVMEIAAAQGRVKERDLLPIYGDLLPLRRELEAAGPRLQGIQQRLDDLLRGERE